MKALKRIFITCFILFLLGLVFRGPLYRACVAYQSVGHRTSYPATDPELVQYIEETAAFKHPPSIEHILHRSLSLTSEKLHFTVANNAVDPNRLIGSRAAHCVGYAAFFATTCNYLFKKYHLETTWSAQPQKGQLYLFGQNVHPYLRMPFFRDHDFVIIRNKATGESIAVDPTVDDYLGIARVSIR